MKKNIIIKNMTCGSCVALNNSTIESMKGVKSVQINLSNGQTIIDFDENIVSLDKIIGEIENNGFSVEQNIDSHKKVDNARKYKIKSIFSAILSLPVFAMMFVDTTLGIEFLEVDISMYIFAVLTFIVVFIFGFNFHKNFFKSLKTLHFNMDSLVSLGTMSAFFYSIFVMFLGMHVYFEAAVSIITLINLGKYLEEKSKQKAGDAIEKLLELGVKKAHVIVNNGVVEKDIDDVELGDIVKVYPGEKIPLDGEIIQGNSSVDESMITGESIPVGKNIGDNVLSSTINCDNYLEIKITKTNKNSTLQQIIQMVNQAQSSRADVQKTVDKISQIFVPVIIIFAIITFIAWYFISGDIQKSLISSVATLVIACPCALGLATPAAIMVSSGVGAKNGILIKNAQSLEKTQNIDIIIFDKTGTLTYGKPEVLDVHILKNNQDINIAKNLANNSHHPLSKAIKNYNGNLENIELKNIVETKGKGISAEYNNQKYFLGNQKIFTNNQVTKDILDTLERISSKGSTGVLFGDESKILGIFELLDTPKQNTKKTLQEIHDLGINTLMLTGDNKFTAKSIARDIGIGDFIAEVLPEDKLQVIQDYQKQGKKVAFVGDGINDAPALTQADLSIAMGTGSDVAINSADIVLLAGDISKVLFTIHLCKKTLRNIKQNLFWAFLYNSIGIPLAALGLLNPIIASVAMSLSSVSVLINALSLKRIKK